MTREERAFPRPFGPYVLKQKLASGGMAELYLAEVTGPGGFIKPLVIKMILGAYSDDERFLSLFTEEAKIVSSLTHGNIVPIFDFGRVEGRLYLAMEFIDGVDVATLMDVSRIQGITLPIEVALFIGVGTAAGLSHAHEAVDSEGNSRSVVHRDVSPHNILLSRTGEVKLCDFGLAAPEVPTERPSQVDEEIRGKLQYLSPELATAGDVDARSDIFSLGVVLFELMAGHHPVPFGTDITILQELSGGTGYRSLGEVAPWISKSVVAVVDRAMAFDPDERFQNSEAMRAELFRILHGDYPNFAPQDLASLVVRAQAASEELRESDEESVLRSKLASFASSSRIRKQELTGGPTSGKSARKTGNRLLLGGSVLILVLLLSFLAVMMTGTGGWRGDEQSGEPSAAGRVPTGARGTPPIHVRAKQPPLPSKPDPGLASPAPRNTKDPFPEAATRETTTDKPVESAAPEKRARGFGLVNINASPWADVRIDGVDYTSTPILGLKLRAGKHKATFVNPELGVTKTRTFVIKPNETVRLLVEMEEE